MVARIRDRTLLSTQVASTNHTYRTISEFEEKGLKARPLIDSPDIEGARNEATSALK